MTNITIYDTEAERLNEAAAKVDRHCEKCGKALIGLFDGALCDDLYFAYDWWNALYQKGGKE